MNDDELNAIRERAAERARIYADMDFPPPQYDRDIRALLEQHDADRREIEAYECTFQRSAPGFSRLQALLQGHGPLTAMVTDAAADRIEALEAALQKARSIMLIVACELSPHENNKHKALIDSAIDANNAAERALGD